MGLEVGVADRSDLQNWIVEALRSKGDRASVTEVCKAVWQLHEPDLRASGDLFFTWQYDIRWAAHVLRRRGLLRPASESPNGIWELR